MQAPPEVIREASDLIDRLRSGLLDDAALSWCAARLDQLLPDPGWFEYAIDHVPELPAIEVVHRAFTYKPLIPPA